MKQRAFLFTVRTDRYKDTSPHVTQPPHSDIGAALPSSETKPGADEQNGELVECGVGSGVASTHLSLLASLPRAAAPLKGEPQLLNYSSI